MSDSVRPLRRARLLSAVLLVLVFVTGTLVGAAMDRAIGEPDGHKRGRHGMEAEMLQRLRLDERQEREVETILERRRAEA
ncbi:MAG TPA: hypothetical protein VLE27_12615, partial [Thermoanaerobaculia bacterium]|nr:hypothetical protein [Thermoanaerobaculia bacterium]